MSERGIRVNIHVDTACWVIREPKKVTTRFWEHMLCYSLYLDIVAD